MGFTLEGNQGGSSPTEPGKDVSSDIAVLTETLDQLLRSRTFSRSGQLKRLLTYLRETAGSTDASVWTELSIGVHAFGRRDFNPKLDTIVRVEMRRLRQKLDEYYTSEGVGSALRLRFERNTYRPFVEPHVATPPAIDLVPAPALSPDRFWKGVMLGAASVGLVMTASVLLWRVFGPAADAVPVELAQSPIWAGFRGTNVAVAIGTPLFFRSNDGFERSFNQNLPDDLGLADQFLLHRPAYPLWNLWAAFEDVPASVQLDRFLRGMNSTSTVVPARDMSYGGLAGKRTIVIGQPRFAPLLLDLLAQQNFRPPEYVPGNHFAGFLNSNPRPGEPIQFPNFGHGLLVTSDESSPDFALVTRMRLPNGGEVLNVFGDRAQTGAFIIRKLIDPAFVADLDARLFKGGKSYQSAQVVYRVDYSRSAPTGLVYVTDRVTRDEKK